VWIAESDDLCEIDFLERIVPAFERESVLLSYGDIQYIDEDDTCSPGLDDYRKSTGYDIWNKPYREPAQLQFAGPFGIKNIIANVSGAVFRRPFLSKEFIEYLSGLKVCGDWIFYMNVARGGDIHYTPAAKSYFRQHRRNTSVTALKTRGYYEEHGKVAWNLRDFYGLDAPVLSTMKEKVRETCLYVFDGEQRLFSFDDAYDGAFAAPARMPRLNIMIASLGFYLGGGEIVPIHMANALHRHGHNVTFFALGHDGLPDEPGVREMLAPGIAVLRKGDIVRDPGLLHDYRFDIVNSHNIGIEYFFEELRQRGIALPKYVVTHHGSYEAATPADELLKAFAAFTDHWIYLAGKNLTPLERAGIDISRATKCANGLSLNEPTDAVTRADLGIADDAFVCVLASRALPEKGWSTALKAVEKLNARACSRPVHLLLLGDGPEYDRLGAQTLPSFVRLLGFRKDAPQFYRLADVGLLPTTYVGESFPLSLVECLLAGRPCIATDIGEIRNMLADDNGGYAGIVLPFLSKTDPVETLADAIARLCDDTAFHAACTASAVAVSGRYGIDNVVKHYENIFRQVCSPGRSTFLARTVL
ncbi:MAG: glycosyltransferase, partial [Alphaproteobacteria bacterium]|nr:glycosyltransferase [Alphaproteobacteria bacterium]